MARAAALGFTPPATLQPQYSLLVRDIEHEIVPASLDAGIGLLPWSPLAGGWLSGKYVRDQPPTGATRLGEDPKRVMEAWEACNADERTWTVLDAVASIAATHQVSASQVALAWLSAQPVWRNDIAASPAAAEEEQVSRSPTEGSNRVTPVSIIRC